MSYTVSSIKAAWEKASEIFPTDYEKDERSSKSAGYPIYWSTGYGVNAWISDLGNCLEVNLPNAESVKIWIKEDEADLESKRKDETIKEQAETIKAQEAKIEQMQQQIDKMMGTIEKLEGWRPYEDKNNVSQKEYDHLRDCGRVMSDDEAKALIVEEFGFAADRIKIIKEANAYEVSYQQRLRKVGTVERLPLYDATDWNYVRFNVNGWAYEMYNGDLRLYTD